MHFFTISLSPPEKQCRSILFEIISPVSKIELHLVVRKYTANNGTVKYSFPVLHLSHAHSIFKVKMRKPRAEQRSSDAGGFNMAASSIM